MNNNKAKIVATLGPASVDEAILRNMMTAGMDCARLNFSHGDLEEKRALFKLLTRLSEESGHQLSVMCDIQGPKIRVGEVAEPFVANVGDVLFVLPEAKGQAFLGNSSRITIREYPILELIVGDVIFINDGVVKIRVVEKSPTELKCVVDTAGQISSKKGCNIPNGTLSGGLPTKKDIRDLELIAELKPDLIAVSFVGCAQDLRNVRSYLDKFGFPNAKLCSKIERPVAMQNLAEIIAESDAVMVARGDLGVEVDPWLVPVYQREIIAMCNSLCTPVIVATQMLESMIGSARPTRAEVSDVFEAVFQGCDAVMLSGETSVGKYPVESVATMDRIALEAVKQISSRKFDSERMEKHPQAKLLRSTAPGVRSIVKHLVEVEHEKVCILCAAHSGATARVLSSLRLPVLIYAFSSDPRSVRALSLLWGVVGLYAPEKRPNSKKGEESFFEAIKLLHSMKLLDSDSLAIVVSASTSLKSHSGMQLCTYSVQAVLERASE